MVNQRFFTRDRLIMLAILFVSAIVYFPALRGLQILDDHVIASGAAIGGGKSFADCFTHPFLFSYYRPLISASFWLEMKMWGSTPFLLHQTNVLIHVATIYLIIRLALEIGLSRVVAYLAGLFFAFQPAQVGAVAWIGGRTDDQACFFLVAMLLAVVKYYKDPRGAWWWIAIGVASALAAMLTKEQAAPAVLAAPLTGLAYRATRRRLFIGSAPYLAAGALFLLFWFTLAPEHVKAATVPPAEVLSQIFRSTLNYALLFAAPNPWSMNTYSLESLRNPVSIALGALLTVLIPVGIWRLWHNDRRLGMLAIIGALLYIPVSNLIPIPSLLAAPYRVALSGPIVAILLAVLAGKLLEPAKASPAPVEGATPRSATPAARWRLVYATAFVPLLAGVALVPWGASLHKDDVTLFAACSRYDNGSLYMRANYTWALNDKGDTASAIRESTMLLDQVYQGSSWRTYETAARTMATDPRIERRVLANHGARAEAGPMVSRYFVMHGQLLMKMHRDDEALRALYAARDIDPMDDNAYFGIGHLLLDRQPTTAVKYLTRAINLNPYNTNAVFMLGHYYETNHDYRNAYYTLVKIQDGHSDTGMPLLDLADAELHLGRYAEARETLREASHMIIEPTRLALLEHQANARS